MSSPTISGKEAIGDSMFLRLCLHFADKKYEKRGYPRQWGLCRSGKTSAELHKEVCALTTRREEDVIVMIGTNDIIRISNSSNSLGRETSALKHRLHKINVILSRKYKKVFWCTPPPIPKLVLSSSPVRQRYEQVTKASCDWIKAFEGGNVAVISLNSIFNLKASQLATHFERKMGSGARERTDMIHWNKKGMTLAFDQIIACVP